MYARWKEPGVPEIFDGGQDITADDIHHPRNIINLWTEAELLAIGLLPFDAAIIPSGHTVDTRSYEEIAGRIVESVTTIPPPPPPTLDEIYDQTIQNQKVLKALVLCLNDGSIVPGANVTKSALKTAIKAKM